MDALQRDVWAVRVKRGVAWMDANKPGWAQKIDVSTLKMSHEYHCILGQSCGNYFETLLELRGLHGLKQDGQSWAMLHGFNAPVNTDDNAPVYVLLAELWLPYILARQRGENLAEPAKHVNVRELAAV